MTDITQTSTLLQLPDEILLQIALNLSETVKKVDPQCNLRALALSCKQLAPIAREALFHAPILHSSQTHLLLETLFKYPQLCTKTRSLTIETKETRNGAMPTPIRLDPALRQKCIDMIQALPIAKVTKDWWISDIEVPKLLFHGPLLCLLFAMLPHIEELYLGGSALFNLPLFRDMLPELDDMSSLQTRRGIKGLSNWDVPNLSCILNIFGPKLKVLELPNDFRLSPKSEPWRIADMTRIAHYFPELRELMVPSWAVLLAHCPDIVPPKLQTLVLTDARSEEPDDWIYDIVLAKKQQQRFPELRNVALYRRRNEIPFNDRFLKCVASAGLRLDEYVPHCVFSSGREWWHPWMYTRAEIDAADDARHLEEMVQLLVDGSTGRNR